MLRFPMLPIMVGTQVIRRITDRKVNIVNCLWNCDKSILLALFTMVIYKMSKYAVCSFGCYKFPELFFRLIWNCKELHLSGWASIKTPYNVMRAPNQTVCNWCSVTFTFLHLFLYYREKVSVYQKKRRWWGVENDFINFL